MFSQKNTESHRQDRFDALGFHRFDVNNAHIRMRSTLTDLPKRIIYTEFIDSFYISEAHMASFEEQKSKYQSVLDIIQSEQVSVKNLHQQDGKLFIKGIAPSQEAANKVWDAIKRVNPSADDITADFPVDTSLQQQQPQPQSRRRRNTADSKCPFVYREGRRYAVQNQPAFLWISKRLSENIRG